LHNLPHILVLDNSPRHLGGRWYPRCLMANGQCRVSTVHPMSGTRLKSLEQFDGLLIGGSPASATQNHEWINFELDLISRAVDREMAVLGVCFGAQLLGRSFFTSRAVCKAKHPEFGWGAVQRLGEDSLFENVPQQFTTFQFHSEEVRSQKEMVVLAFNDNSEVQAFRIKDKQVWGLQFHPEVTPSAGRDFLRKTQQVYTPYGFDYETLISQAQPNFAAQPLFGNFIQASWHFSGLRKEGL
jgi:GMP synthase-like glutamine amidotransferase